MQILSNELLEKELLAFPDAEETGEFVKETPIGYDKDFFEKFMRLLDAKSIDECNDITNEDCLKMLAEGENLFKMIRLQKQFSSYMLNTLSSYKSVMTTRRVL